MRSLLPILLFAQAAVAVVPTDPRERRGYIASRLTDLPLSTRARDDLRRHPVLSKTTVDQFVRLDREERRRLLAERAYLESEIARDVAQRELRLTMSDVELDLWVKDGRIPKPSLLSMISSMPLSGTVHRVLVTQACRTLEDVRVNLLEEMIYGLPPLTQKTAQAMRDELVHLPLPESQMVITVEEARFGAALAEARLGRRARETMRSFDVRTFADLRELPLATIETRSQIDRKTVLQIRALLRNACADAIVDSDPEE